MKSDGSNRNSWKRVGKVTTAGCEEGHRKFTSQLVCPNGCKSWHSNIHWEFMTRKKVVEWEEWLLRVKTPVSIRLFRKQCLEGSNLTFGGSLQSRQIWSILGRPFARFLSKTGTAALIQRIRCRGEGYHVHNARVGHVTGPAMGRFLLHRTTRITQQASVGAELCTRRGCLI